ESSTDPGIESPGGERASVRGAGGEVQDLIAIVTGAVVEMHRHFQDGGDYRARVGVRGVALLVALGAGAGGSGHRGEACIDGRTPEHVITARTRAQVPERQSFAHRADDDAR